MLNGEGDPYLFPVKAELEFCLSFGGRAEGAVDR